MRYSKLQNELRLILLLADSVGYTAIELSKKMNISRRQIYYLLDFIKSAGFILFKQDNKYHIDRRSSFFAELSQTLQFTDTEIRTIYNMLLMTDNSNDMVNQLRAKLDRTYNFSQNIPPAKQQAYINNVKIITNAIRNKRMLRFVGYSSPHSHSFSDRVVEPFLLMNNNQDVRCHEMFLGYTNIAIDKCSPIFLCLVARRTITSNSVLGNSPIIFLLRNTHME